MMELISALITIFFIGLGIAVLSSSFSKSSGCYKRSYYICSECRKKECKYYKLSQLLERMEIREDY